MGAYAKPLLEVSTVIQMVVSTIAYPSTLVLSMYILCDSFNTFYCSQG